VARKERKEDFDDFFKAKEESEARCRATESPPKEDRKIIHLALCEQDKVILRPGILYEFSVAAGCEECKQAEKVCGKTE